MDVERDRIVEVAVAVVAVALMLGTMYWVGSTYSSEDGGLSTGGGEVLVGVIVAFVLVMTAVGVGLAYALNPAADDATDPDDPGDGNAA